MCTTRLARGRTVCLHNTPGFDPTQVYCWEDMVSGNIKAARDWEMKKLVTKQYLSGIATFFGYTGPILATGVAFGVYSAGA